jgi:hypothetical protein
MSRETHVRFSEGVGVGFPRATRLSARLRNRRRGTTFDWPVSRLLQRTKAPFES